MQGILEGEDIMDNIVGLSNGLNESVSSMEWIYYLEEKYQVNNIVTRKTVNIWCKEYGIQPIDANVRKADIKYNRKDMLNLEYEKRNYFKKKQFNNQKIKDAEERVSGLYRNLDVSMEQPDIGDQVYYQCLAQADKIIFQDMLMDCYKKLFEEKYFDKKELANMIYIIDENTDATEMERFNALNYIETKQYKKIMRKDTTDFRIIRE